MKPQSFTTLFVAFCVAVTAFCLPARFAEAGSACGPSQDCAPTALQSSPLRNPKNVANLATCYGASCNGLDPYATGCAYDGVVLATTYLYSTAGSLLGYTQLWWSGTCQTKWAYTAAYLPPYRISAQVTRADGRFSYARTNYYASSVSSFMVHATQQTAIACGQIWPTPSMTSQACTPWR